MDFAILTAGNLDWRTAYDLPSGREEASPCPQHMKKEHLPLEATEAELLRRMAKGDTEAFGP